MDCGNAARRELEAVTKCHLFDIVDDCTGEIYKENLLFAQAHLWAAENGWTVIRWESWCSLSALPGTLYVQRNCAPSSLPSAGPTQWP